MQNIYGKSFNSHFDKVVQLLRDESPEFQHGVSTIYSSVVAYGRHNPMQPLLDPSGPHMVMQPSEDSEMQI